MLALNTTLGPVESFNSTPPTIFEVVTGEVTGKELLVGVEFKLLLPNPTPLNPDRVLGLVGELVGELGIEFEASELRGVRFDGVDVVVELTGPDLTSEFLISGRLIWYPDK